MRCAVVLDSLKPGAWVARAVKDIQADGAAGIVLVLLDEAAAEERRGSRLFRWYEQWDYRRNRAEQDALAPTDVMPFLANATIVRLERSGEASGPAMEEVRAANLDLILDLGTRAAYRKIAAPAYGVWRVRHDLDLDANDGQRSGWEALEQSTATENVVEVRHAGSAAGAAISRSFATVERTSLYLSRNPVYWKSAEMLVRSVRRAALGDAAALQDSHYPAPTFRRPTEVETALHLARHASEWLRRRANKAGMRPAHKWHIAIRQRSDRRFNDPEGYSLMPCPEDRFYADPFLFEHHGRTFLFFEDYRYELGRAVISCCELDEQGRPGEPVEVLRRPYHLSYPAVFEDGGAIYMMPETRGKETIEIYRATDFPFVWEPDGTLMEGVNAVDATIYRRDGRYWMFSSLSDGRFSNSDEVSLFYADRLRGPWTPHRMNPLVADVRRARPAGRLFDDGGRLVRPSQDCSKMYGYGLVFSEVVQLTETKYEEQVVSRMEPESYAGCIANHTYNRTERFEVIDRTLPADSAIKR